MGFVAAVSRKGRKENIDLECLFCRLFAVRWKAGSVPCQLFVSTTKNTEGNILQRCRITYNGCVIDPLQVSLCPRSKDSPDQCLFVG